MVYWGSMTVLRWSDPLGLGPLLHCCMKGRSSTKVFGLAAHDWLQGELGAMEDQGDKNDLNKTKSHKRTHFGAVTKNTNLIEVTRHCGIFLGAVKNYPYVIEGFWTRRWEWCQLHCGVRHFDPSEEGFKWTTQIWDNQRLLHQKLGIQTKMQNTFLAGRHSKIGLSENIRESCSNVPNLMTCAYPFPVFLKNELPAGERGRVLNPSKALLAGLLGDPSLRNVPRGLQLDTQLHGLKSPDMISTVDENLLRFSISDGKKHTCWNHQLNRTYFFVISEILSRIYHSLVYSKDQLWIQLGYISLYENTWSQHHLPWLGPKKESTKKSFLHIHWVIFLVAILNTWIHTCWCWSHQSES